MQIPVGALNTPRRSLTIDHDGPSVSRARTARAGESLGRCEKGVLTLINLLINLTFTVSMGDTHPPRRSTFNRPIRITKRVINLGSGGRNWAFNYDGRLSVDFRLGQRGDRSWKHASTFSAFGLVFRTTRTARSIRQGGREEGRASKRASGRRDRQINVRRIFGAASDPKARERQLYGPAAPSKRRNLVNCPLVPVQSGIRRTSRDFDNTPRRPAGAACRKREPT